jgi:hypothetical protein
MTVARSVGDVLSEHVRFEVECIGRMYLNVYVPGLQYAAGLVAYVHQQLGLPIASTAPLARITRFRPVLPQVLLLLPLQRKAVHQRQRVGPNVKRRRRGSSSHR